MAAGFCSEKIHIFGVRDEALFRQDRRAAGIIHHGEGGGIQRSSGWILENLGRIDVIGVADALLSPEADAGLRHAAGQKAGKPKAFCVVLPSRRGGIGLKAGGGGILRRVPVDAEEQPGAVKVGLFPAAVQPGAPVQIPAKDDPVGGVSLQVRGQGADRGFGQLGLTDDPGGAGILPAVAGIQGDGDAGVGKDLPGPDGSGQGKKEQKDAAPTDTATRYADPCLSAILPLE